MATNYLPLGPLGRQITQLALQAEGGEDMRFMITCRIPVDKGNELAKTGSLGSTIQSIMEELEPEAAYFSDIQFATKLL